MLGCKPAGRFTEQHDVFFGIGTSVKSLVPQMIAFWPEAKGQLHIDAWREVSMVDGFEIKIVDKKSQSENDEKLFFINLGGYKENEFDEFHYKLLLVSPSLSDATKKAKQTAFYKHYDFPGAVSHIDDKYGIDVDDIYKVEEMLNSELKANFQLQITKSEIELSDTLHIGYIPLSKL